MKWLLAFALALGLIVLAVVDLAVMAVVQLAFGDVVVMRVVRHDFSGGTIVLGDVEPIPLPAGDGPVWRAARVPGDADFLLRCSGGEDRDGYFDGFGPMLVLVEVSDCRIDHYDQRSMIGL